MRAGGNQRRRDAHVLLLRRHPADQRLVVPGFLAARIAALKQPIIALSVEQPLFVKARLLETVIHIGGNYKIVLALQKLK